MLPRRALVRGLQVDEKALDHSTFGEIPYCCSLLISLLLCRKSAKRGIFAESSREDGGRGSGRVWVVDLGCSGG